MAKEEKKEEKKEESGANDGKKSKKLLIIVIVAILVLIIVAGIAVAMLLMKEDDTHSNNNAAHTQETQHSTPQTQEKNTTPKPRDSSENIDSRKLSQIGVLYPLDTFTVNLKSDSGRRYLKATISLELNGQELSIELDKKAAVIRDRIIRILTSKTLEEISSQKGKQKITEQIMDTLNSMIADGSIKGIYFTEFVIQ